jgi:inner membrane transporter RhtA
MSNSTRSASLVVPVLTLIAAMVCFQVGASLAKGLFPLVGATGATALRTGLAATMLTLVWRPWRLRFGPGDARSVVIFGVALGVMNLSFYTSLKYIPLGIAVAIEFTGPLAVALAASRRPVDYLWIALAALGLLALLPLKSGAQSLSLVGILLALGAGVCWALYIVYGRRAGTLHGGGAATALGLCISSLFIVPIGLATNGTHLISLDILPQGLLVALISSALPYSLEMIAMPKIPTRTLGVLLSLDPALGAVAGVVLLSERLNWLQWGAIVCIMVASAGSATSQRIEVLPD